MFCLDVKKSESKFSLCFCLSVCFFSFSLSLSLSLSVSLSFARGLDEKRYCTYSITLVNKKNRSFVLSPPPSSSSNNIQDQCVI